MRTAGVIGLTIFALVLPVYGQQPPGPGRPNRPALQPDRPGPGGPGLGPMARRLAEELNLNDAQREQYDGIVDKYQQQAEEHQGQREQMRELARQLREARQSGDDQRADEIRTQMGELGVGRAQIMRDFANEVEAILDASQVKKLNEFRERFQRGAEAGRRFGQMRELVDRLPDELGLSEAQRSEFDALAAEQRQQFGGRREQWRDLRPLLDELRAAQAAGDQERVTQLQAELDQKRPTPPDFQEFFSKLEPILTDEQKAKLAKLREDLAPPAERGAADVRTVLQAAKRLDLNDQQQERLKTIAREAQAAERQGPNDAAARAQRAGLVKTQIVEMLDAKQAAEFERLLRAERPGRPERRGPGGGREDGQRRGNEGPGGPRQNGRGAGGNWS